MRRLYAASVIATKVMYGAKDIQNVLASRSQNVQPFEAESSLRHPLSRRSVDGAFFSCAPARSDAICSKAVLGSAEGSDGALKNGAATRFVAFVRNRNPTY